MLQKKQWCFELPLVLSGNQSLIALSTPYGLFHFLQSPCLFNTISMHHNRSISFFFIFREGVKGLLNNLRLSGLLGVCTFFSPREDTPLGSAIRHVLLLDKRRAILLNKRTCPRVPHDEISPCCRRNRGVSSYPLR